ncbi:MAG: elongation factor 4 [Chloroflexi bacterium]|nr:elongation factor 4 [Chloroflexota bacterium]
MQQSHIRNFCIIAHIDHGKSTLADRLLEATNTIERRRMMDQVLDSMDLERERGITIKMHPTRMLYRAKNGQDYQLNLIDTPGHVEFSYEVSRSVAACEGALLIVDASQGSQAQTLANVYLALESNLEIIPVVNKIDLPGAEPDRVAQELQDVFGFKESEILRISGKTGLGVPELLETIIERVPPPAGKPDASLRALIFDSKYDPYKGVIASVRVVDGSVSAPGRRLRFMATGRIIEPLEAGAFKPDFLPLPILETGSVGYIATGLKTVEDAKVGDTITWDESPAATPVAGYKELKSMVFAGLFPADGQNYLPLREALEKLKLNDAGLVFQQESSGALGFGFRCGFLGLLHMEIVQDRLEREYNLDLLATAPSVAYQVVKTDGEVVEVDNPAKLPAPNYYDEIREPWLEVTIIVPNRYVGGIMDLVSNKRGEFKKMDYLDSRPANTAKDAQEPSKDPRVMLVYHIPLAEVLIDFYDQLKSRTQGYATMDYAFLEYRPGNLVKLDILVNGKPVDALSLITHRDNAYYQGKALVEKLKDLIPRQMFEVPLQAAIGSKVIARETVRAMRKNVLAKCYGGDVTRKMKLLHKQAEGKKRMKMVGSVEIPQEAFLALLKLEK